MVNHFKPNTILELGTSLGISTLYMASANQNSKVYTIEACPETYGIAKNNFIGLKNRIDAINENFDNEFKNANGNSDFIIPVMQKIWISKNISYIPDNKKGPRRCLYFYYLISNRLQEFGTQQSA